MRVFVKSIRGESITCASTDASVDSIKAAIFDVEGIPVEHQRLVFEGKEMEDGRTLSFYNVKENSTVHLMLGLPGGSFHRIPRNLVSLARFYIENKKICRQCYGRLPANATRCRKVKCGRTHDIRWKKAFYGNHNKTEERYPEELRLKKNTKELPEYVLKFIKE